MTELTPPTQAASQLPVPLAVHTPPRQQLGDLPIEELRTIAEEFGLDARTVTDKNELISSIHKRRQLIASLDRAALIDAIHWTGKTPPVGAANEQLAIEIVQNRSMRFSGLSDRGLLALALLRGCELDGVKSREELVKQLKSQEGLYSKLKRKTRGWVGKRIQRIIGDETTAPAAGATATALPPPGQTTTGPRPVDAGPRQQALREEIEEAGFFSGIANRVKRQADTYVNQKLDEIEARIDRKLDEIDRRLAEWRDKEIANRIRILKITLWVSVVVAVISLLYSYVQVMTKQWKNPLPSTTPTSITAPAGTTSSSAPNIVTRMKPSFPTFSKPSPASGRST
ncbi:MAG TPA: hypothetical protein VF595_00405 [Tepidisphaeraceae bacterium]|jgi:hypothetical protein